MKEAMLYKKEEDHVQCELCPHNCKIKEGKRGLCGVRENREGKLYSLVYGKAIANSIDSIEKKPFFHFLPGSASYSIATVGCNLFCDFCQNWEISQQPKPDNDVMGKDLSPQTIVDEAVKSGCESIAYTYTEPTIFFEYAYDTAKLAHEKGLRNVFVSNGFISKKAIEKILPYLDAVNIDLKGFTEDYYKRICHAKLQPVLDAIRYYHEKGVFVEVTSLIVPGHNDSEEMLREIARFIVSVDKSIPWHISRFSPHHKMDDVPPTPIETLEKARKIGEEEGVKYIYLGNVMTDINSYCPECSAKLVERSFKIESYLEGGKCPHCGEKQNFVVEDA